MAGWREQVQAGIADHRAHGKEPLHEPQTEAEWDNLQKRFPSALYAVWYVLTGRRVS